MKKIAILALLLMATMAAAQTPEYDVYAIKYATIRRFPHASLIKGADAAKKTDIAMMFWLVRAGHRNILVDTGFYRPNLFAGWDIVDYVRPEEAVFEGAAEIG